MAKKSAANKPQSLREGPQGQGAPNRSSAKPAMARQALDQCADRGSVPPLPGGQSGTEGRAEAHQSVHAAGGGGAVGAGDRRRRQQGDARAVRRRRHAGEDGRARRGARARADQDHRAVPHQGQERGRAVAPAGGRAWRAGAAHARGAGGAARRRAQDRQCGAQYRVSASRPSRSTPTSSASATAPAWRREKIRSRSSRNSKQVVPAQYKRTRTIG